MSITPAGAQRWVRYGVYVTVLLLVVVGTRELNFVRVRSGDRGTPEARPGTLTLVRTREQDDGELRRESLYFVAYETEDGTSQPRLARLVGLPGEAIECQDTHVTVGGRMLSVAPEVARRWPAVVPAEHCLLLTDERPAGHLDSRELGPVEVRRLLWRVVIPLAFLP